jgi:uncharacterized protein with PIN domain
VKQALFRFYAELNDFLPPGRRAVDFAVSFHVSAPVRDLIESLGPPHTEVDLILANGESVDFSYLVQDGDRISVYPVFESLDLSPLARLRPQPLREPRFVLDAHLGKLAVFLRLLGFDSLYRNDYTDEELARIAAGEERILLTRDRALLKRAAVTRGSYVRASAPRQQLADVLARFDLAASAAPFTRCMACNHPLERAEKDAVLPLLPPRVREKYDEFLRCPACQRVYWKGSHYERMSRMLESLRMGSGL